LHEIVPEVVLEITVKVAVLHEIVPEVVLEITVKVAVFA
jgi:hypothetical protein